MSVDEEGVRDLTIGRKPSSEPCSRSRTFKLSELFFVEKMLFIGQTCLRSRTFENKLSELFLLKIF
jgi:hypothetical protein